MMTTQEAPRIYVASLADYNNGVLHGRWIDAAQDASDIEDEIQAMLAESSEPVAEDWAIHDFDGFEGIRLSEYESIERIAAIAAGIDEHGAAFAAWFDNYPARDLDNWGDEFDEQYAGEYDDLGTFAAELLSDMGTLNDVPASLQSYIDFDGYGRDLELGGDVWTSDTGTGKVYVFWNR
jgi:antirestriction protein